MLSSFLYLICLVLQRCFSQTLTDGVLKVERFVRDSCAETRLCCPVGRSLYGWGFGLKVNVSVASVFWLFVGTTTMTTCTYDRKLNIGACSSLSCPSGFPFFSSLI